MYLLLVFAGIGSRSLMWGMNGEKKRKNPEPVNPLPAKRLKIKGARKIVIRKKEKKELCEMKKHLDKFLRRAKVDPCGMLDNKILQYTLAFEIITGGKDYLNPAWLREKKREYIETIHPSIYDKQERLLVKRMGDSLGEYGAKRLPKLRVLNEKLSTLLDGDSASFSEKHSHIPSAEVEHKSKLYCYEELNEEYNKKEIYEHKKQKTASGYMELYARKMVVLQRKLQKTLQDVLGQEWSRILSSKFLRLAAAYKIIKDKKISSLTYAWLKERKLKHEQQLKEISRNLQPQYYHQQEVNCFKALRLLPGMEGMRTRPTILTKLIEKIYAIYRIEQIDQESELLQKVDREEKELRDATSPSPQEPNKEKELDGQYGFDGSQNYSNLIEIENFLTLDTTDLEKQISVGDAIEDDLGDDAWRQYFNETYINNSTEIT
jgi:hypothetical protein